MRSDAQSTVNVERADAHANGGPPPALPERVEEGERLLFAAAESALRGPQAAWNLIASHLARRYLLCPDDRVDTDTGEITRGREAEE
jgi:hypothetical protein